MAFAVISKSTGTDWRVRFYRVVDGRRVARARLASEVTCRWPMVLALVGPVDAPTLTLPDGTPILDP